MANPNGEMGTRIEISSSTFADCVAEAAGGGVSAKASGTRVHVQSSSFERCRSSSGGAIYSADMSTLLVDAGTFFSECSATEDGGAVSVVNGISIVFESSAFRNCTAAGRGGAVFVSGGGTSASANVLSCSFLGNGAMGLGGGGLYVSNIHHVVGKLECHNNTALLGGGGLLMWDGAFVTEVAEGAVSICDVESGDRALYGPVIASSFKSLAFSGGTSLDSLASAGLMFSVVVTKTDYYGQRISSDGHQNGGSSSLIQAKTSLGGARSLDSSVQLLGTSIAAVLAGRATFVLAVKPTFSLVNASAGTTSLLRAALVYFEGTDAEVGGQMLSAVAEVHLAQDGAVCPRGYVLSLEEGQEAAGRPGQCSVCPVGTYSLHPLAGRSSAAGPACLSCPAGGVCPGGDSVTFAVGNWSVVNYEWKLESCPSGYAATTAKNGCVVCAAGKYSLREGVMHECLTCPAGGDCIAGGGVVTFAVGEWSVVNSVWQLDSCPSGYETTNTNDACIRSVFSRSERAGTSQNGGSVWRNCSRAPATRCEVD